MLFDYIMKKISGKLSGARAGSHHPERHPPWGCSALPQVTYGN